MITADLDFLSIFGRLFAGFLARLVQWTSEPLISRTDAMTTTPPDPRAPLPRRLLLTGLGGASLALGAAGFAYASTSADPTETGDGESAWVTVVEDDDATRDYPWHRSGGGGL